MVDSGVRNSRLYFNLANAYLQSGETGRAVANYRRSLKLDPTNRDSRTNLAHAESLMKSPSAVGDSDFVSLANGWLNRLRQPTKRAGHVNHRLDWPVGGDRRAALRRSLSVEDHGRRRHLAFRRHRRVVRIELRRVFPKCGRRHFTQRVAAQRATVSSFPAVANVELGEGQAVEVLKRRGEWVQIRTAVGQSGWLPSRLVESI